jgi:hypothetical protein
VLNTIVVNGQVAFASRRSQNLHIHNLVSNYTCPIMQK